VNPIDDLCHLAGLFGISRWGDAPYEVLTRGVSALVIAWPSGESVELQLQTHPLMTCNHVCLWLSWKAWAHNLLGYGHSVNPVRSRQVVRGQSYSSCSLYDCLVSIIHNCWTRLASGNAQHLSQPVPLHHCLVHKHQSSNY
jgi:hypothetical protein